MEKFAKGTIEVGNYIDEGNEKRRDFFISSGWRFCCCSENNFGFDRQKVSSPVSNRRRCMLES